MRGSASGERKWKRSKARSAREGWALDRKREPTVRRTGWKYSAIEMWEEGSERERSEGVEGEGRRESERVMRAGEEEG